MAHLHRDAFAHLLLTQGEAVARGVSNPNSICAPEVFEAGLLNLAGWIRCGVIVQVEQVVCVGLEGVALLRACQSPRRICCVGEGDAAIDWIVDIGNAGCGP